MSLQVKNSVCLVTGGGGSIGGELVRRLAALGAREIVIVDIYENGAYDVMCETGDSVRVEIASTRDFAGMERIFAEYRPAFVFHAAAHKHVPFMENNPEEAVKNNIRGTEITAELAERYGAKNFVLVSTDKAVEPSSVMGASKRICEMLIYERHRQSRGTKFFTVRFGNVVNSNGSVIPLFKRQIEKGTLTVTHAEVTRYFMSIPDAVTLIMQSLDCARGGEVFVADMGERVKILDIAEKLIRESGKEPYKDVEIEFTGLRRGDKLHEKLFFDFEKREKTDFDGLFRVEGSSTAGIYEAVAELYKMADTADRDEIRKKIFEIANGES